MDHVSDLHIDNGQLGGPHGNFGHYRFEDRLSGGPRDVLIVAGDTGEFVDDTADFLNAARDHYDAVVAVLGNHERGGLNKALREGVHILDLTLTHRVDLNRVAFVGACLAPEDREQAKQVQVAYANAECDALIDRIVLVSHYVPLTNLMEITGRPVHDKCNDFLREWLALDPIKDTTVVFGHVHLEVDIEHDGYRLVSNPRGYRGLRRDGSSFKGFKQL